MNVVKPFVGQRCDVVYLLNLNYPISAPADKQYLAMPYGNLGYTLIGVHVPHYWYGYELLKVGTLIVKTVK